MFFFIEQGENKPVAVVYPPLFKAVYGLFMLIYIFYGWPDIA